MKMTVIAIMVLFMIPTSSAAEPVSTIAKNVTVQEALVVMGQNADRLIILDTRTPEEYATGCLEKAINLNYYAATFRADLEKLSKEAVILVYCGSGRRSEAAMAVLTELGFREVYNLLGGISAWIREKQPVAMPEPNHD